MKFADIGQQLRAYRLESGLRAEEIAARLGVSRAALYRYEKGEVIKLDTVRRLAELLKISPLSLLGIGVEYFARPVVFLERLRQIEERCVTPAEFRGPTAAEPAASLILDEEDELPPPRAPEPEPSCQSHGGLAAQAISLREPRR